jgi:DNA-binding response OmpR family regulator
MSTKKIFILDDDMTALDLIDFLFEERGFEVSRGTGGKQALEQVASINPDIILVDLMMPEMSGQECVRELRRQGVTVPIVAFTAVDDSDLHQEALDAGCNIVLTKPCKPSILLDKVIHVLNEASQESSN